MDNEMFFLPEERSGFQVSTKRKKVWRAGMDILREFAEVCSKYDITWYADYGTLLGAIRHKGFIPWDDDIDVSIMRQDYNRFLNIASDEFHFPFRVYDPDKDGTVYFFTKLYNVNTSFITNPNIPPECKPQCLALDIFPMDDIGTNGPEEVARSFFFVTTNLPDGDDYIKSDFIDRFHLPIGLDDIKAIESLSGGEIITIYNDFCGRHCGIEEYVGYSVETWLNTDINPRKRTWYGEPVLLPFEDITVPCPCDPVKCLEAEYGDWQTLKKPANGSYHKGIYEPDIPYMELMSL